LPKPAADRPAYLAVENINQQPHQDTLSRCHRCYLYGIITPHGHSVPANRSLKLMPKRGSDADQRIFFDQLLSLAVSRLKASGAIRLEDRQAVIRFGQQDRLIAVSHTRFPNGGSWSYFVCPRCGGRRKKLWLVDDAPRCVKCCWSLGVRYRASYGFGRTARLGERDRRVDRLQAMLEGGPMRLKPVPPNWGNRRLDRRNRLTWALQQARIATRLAQLAYQGQQSGESDEPLAFLRAYKPRAAAINAIPDPQIALALQISGRTRTIPRQCPMRHTRSIGKQGSSNPVERRKIDVEDAAGKTAWLELVGSNETLRVLQAMSQSGGKRA
jgi:hypothetical protein